MGRSKAKGTTLESSLVKYGHSLGFADMERVVLSGKNDRGDVGWIRSHGISGVAECKNYSGKPNQSQLERWFAETDAEKANGNWDFAILVVHEPGCNASDYKAPTFGRNRAYMRARDWHLASFGTLPENDSGAWDTWIQLTVGQIFSLMGE